MRGSQQMAPDSEQILDHAVGRGEALRRVEGRRGTSRCDLAGALRFR